MTMFFSKSSHPWVLPVTEWVKICNKHYVPWRTSGPLDVKKITEGSRAPLAQPQSQIHLKPLLLNGISLLLHLKMKLVVFYLLLNVITVVVASWSSTVTSFSALQMMKTSQNFNCFRLPEDNGKQTFFNTFEVTVIIYIYACVHDRVTVTSDIF